MKSIGTALTLVLLACGLSYGQETEPGPGFEHLKCYGPFLGTWRYEGPLEEELPDMAKKGSEFVFEISFRRILNKSAVEENWHAEFEGGGTFSRKAIIGWNAAEKKIVYGAMDSAGAMGIGGIDVDTDSKFLTNSEEGVNGDGEDAAYKGVVTKTGKDTLTWQALERKGSDLDDPSPVYTFKRVERKKKAAE